MSEKHDLLLKQMADSFRPVVVGVRATVNHLKEWTDGFPASTSGAAPSGPAPLPAMPADGGVDPDFVLDARRFDRAALKIQQIFDLVDLLTVEVADLAEHVPGVRIVSPVQRLEARVEFIQCQIVRLRSTQGAVSLPLEPLRRAADRADHLSRLVTVNAPAAKQCGVPAGGCVSHARAGEWAEIGDRYRRPELCRRCGEFKTMHRQLPPPKLIRLAEKHGWRVALAPSTLTKFGVKVSPVRRGA